MFPINRKYRKAERAAAVAKEASKDPRVGGGSVVHPVMSDEKRKPRDRQANESDAPMWGKRWKSDGFENEREQFFQEEQKRLASEWARESQDFAKESRYSRTRDVGTGPTELRETSKQSSLVAAESNGNEIKPKSSYVTAPQESETKPGNPDRELIAGEPAGDELSGSKDAEPDLRISRILNKMVSTMSTIDA